MVSFSKRQKNNAGTAKLTALGTISFTKIHPKLITKRAKRNREAGLSEPQGRHHACGPAEQAQDIQE